MLMKEIRDTPLIAKRKARLEIEKMILGTRPVGNCGHSPHLLANMSYRVRQVE